MQVTQNNTQDFHVDDSGPEIKEALDLLLTDAGLTGSSLLPSLQEAIRPEDLELSIDQRLEIVDQALVLFRQLYVNRPLKESVHAVQPDRRLELLRLELERQEGLEVKAPATDFHRQMTEIFMSVHDRHMRYFLPRAFHDRWAILGFEVEQYFVPSEQGLKPCYMLSRAVRDSVYGGFIRGAEIVSWNGIPIQRAIELNGDRHAGSNPAARLAQGLVRLTVRPLWVSPIPDEPWVIVGYRLRHDDGSFGELCYLKFDWLVVHLPSEKHHPPAPFRTSALEEIRLGPVPTLARQVRIGTARPDHVAANAEVETVEIGPMRRRQVIEEVFLETPPEVAAAALAESMDEEADAVRRIRKKVLRGPTSLADNVPEAWSRMPGVLRGAVLTAGDHTYGYLRLYTFSVADEDEFIDEVARQLRHFREILDVRGLILDVRDNSGGLIPAGERLLQLLSPCAVEPQRFELLATPANLKLSLRERHLKRWRPSLEQGAKIGAVYSGSFPITHRPSSTDKQIFDRPVVLIVNAQSYSTTDIFAAGFQDHGLGKILATDDNVGAGGANTVSHADLCDIAGGQIAALRPLPAGVGMKVALRRALRVGDQAGTPLESLGIQPDARHYMTSRDLLEHNVDLIAAATALLETIPSFEVKAQRDGHGANVDLSQLESLRQAASHVELQVEGQTRALFSAADGPTVKMAAPAVVRADLLGRSGELVASRRAPLNSGIDLRCDPFLSLYYLVRGLAASGSPAGYFKAAVDALRDSGVATQAIDSEALATTSAVSLGQTNDDLRELASELEKLEPQFLSSIWPRQRGEIERRISWLGQNFTTVEHGVLDHALHGLEIKDPVIKTPIYLVYRAPDPHAFTYQILGRLAIAVVDVRHHRKALLPQVLLFHLTSLLAREGRSAVLSKLSSLASERGLSRYEDLEAALIQVQAEQSVLVRLGLGNKDDSSENGIKSIVRNAWDLHLRRAMSRAQALESMVDEVAALED